MQRKIIQPTQKMVLATLRQRAIWLVINHPIPVKLWDMCTCEGGVEELTREIADIFLSMWSVSRLNNFSLQCGQILEEFSLEL